jgi:hypothetical protein
MNNFQIQISKIIKMMCGIKKVAFTIHKGNEKFTINGLHGVLAFYRFDILGCFG